MLTFLALVASQADYAIRKMAFWGNLFMDECKGYADETCKKDEMELLNCI